LPLETNALLAFEVRDCRGVVRYRHPQYDAPRFSASTATGEMSMRDTTACVDIGVRLRRDVAAEIVATAVPGTGRWLPVGLLVLAALLVTIRTRVVGQSVTAASSLCEVW